VADKDLTVRMRLDKGQADASAQQFHSAELARINRLRDAQTRNSKAGVEGIQAQQREVARLGAGFDKAGASLAEFRTMMAGAAAAAGGMRVISEAMAASSAAVTSSGQAATQFERKSRQLGALTGRPGDAARDVIGFAMKTGMSLEQSDAYQQAYLGSAPSGIQKGFITEDLSKEVMEKSGVMAARQGASPKVRGELAGLMAQFKKYTSATDVLGDLEKVRMGLTEGRGEDAPLTESLIHVAGSFVDQGAGGMIADLPELAAQIGTASIGAGALGADVRTKQLGALVRGGSREQQKFVKDFTGIDYDKDNMETRLAKLMGALQGVKEKGRDPQAYLAEQGIDPEKAQAAAEMLGVYDVYKTRLAKSREAGKGEEVEAANAAFLRSKEARAQQGETSVKAAEILTGQKNMDWVGVVEKARGEWVATGEDESTISNLMSGVMGRLGGGLIGGGIKEGREHRIRNLAIQKLRSQAGAAGIDTGPMAFSASQDEEGRMLIEALMAKKIEPGANMKAVENLLNKQTGMMEEEYREKKNAPGPAMNARPVNAAMAR
jgi:hypothetical protein